MVNLFVLEWNFLLDNLMFTYKWYQLLIIQQQMYLRSFQFYRNNCNQISNEIYCQLAYNSSNIKCLWINSSFVYYFDFTNSFTNKYNEYQCIRYGLLYVIQNYQWMRIKIMQ
ncbi:unnamed protein product [Paramecium primaurelia]|uniref:Uncharacterized protein n=1 Tax=Paramecium primaurelia TaxID=5886 RepID=A0A8S1QP08_PARPR|nr:unnamed protein product [Paramecium primaurelia]